MEQERSVYACPHCESPDFVKFGKEKTIQRYRCKKCSKTFRSTTGTSLHYLHKKNLVEKYIQTMRSGLSVRKAAKTVGVSTGTAFVWRHKFLASLSRFNVIGKQTDAVGNGVKIIKLPYSDKGRKKEAEKTTKQSVSMVVSGNDTISIIRLMPSNHVKNASEILKELNSDNLIAEIPDKVLKPALDKSGVNRLNKRTQAYKNLKDEVSLKVSHLMIWMDKFQGVATKYLHHYWSWFSIIENTKVYIESHKMFFRLCTESKSREEFFQTYEK